MIILPIINILFEINLSIFYYPVKIMNSSILQNMPCLFSLCVCVCQPYMILGGKYFHSKSFG